VSARDRERQGLKQVSERRSPVDADDE